MYACTDGEEDEDDDEGFQEALRMSLVELAPTKSPAHRQDQNTLRPREGEQENGADNATSNGLDWEDADQEKEPQGPSATGATVRGKEDGAANAIEDGLDWEDADQEELQGPSANGATVRGKEDVAANVTEDGLDWEDADQEAPHSPPAPKAHAVEVGNATEDGLDWEDAGEERMEGPSCAGMAEGRIGNGTENVVKNATEDVMEWEDADQEQLQGISTPEEEAEEEEDFSFDFIGKAAPKQRRMIGQVQGQGSGSVQRQQVESVDVPAASTSTAAEAEGQVPSFGFVGVALARRLGSKTKGQAGAFVPHPETMASPAADAGRAVYIKQEIEEGGDARPTVEKTLPCPAGEAGSDGEAHDAHGAAKGDNEVEDEEIIVTHGAYAAATGGAGRGVHIKQEVEEGGEACPAVKNQIPCPVGGEES
eukprot:gene30425-35431_t